VAAEHVGVHLLGQADRALARLFATSGADRFATTPWRTAYAGVPVLTAPAGWLVGRVVDRLDAGDSTLVLARVEASSPAPARRDPLVWADGDFRQAV
jgi:flavin reductase (DIM6/NTAB) family NADH-FMN oxidoreductase RutF